MTLCAAVPSRLFAKGVVCHVSALKKGNGPTRCRQLDARQTRCRRFDAADSMPGLFSYNLKVKPYILASNWLGIESAASIRRHRSVPDP